MIDPSIFFLLGIPGLEQFHMWLSLPVCCLGTATIVGNITILVVVATEPTLHRPVYLFLCMLSTIDLAASFSTVPKLLAILWCGAGHISASACLTQMFFIHAFCMMESTVLLAMAFDRSFCPTRNPVTTVELWFWTATMQSSVAVWRICEHGYASAQMQVIWQSGEEREESWQLLGTAPCQTLMSASIFHNSMN